jgi:hypothetical protein
VRHALEKLGEALVGQPAAEEQRRLDGADRRVHGQSHFPAGQVRPQRRQQVHPLLDVVPLRPAQPAPLVLGQGAHLTVVDGERVAVGQRYLDVVAHQQRQGLALVEPGRDDGRRPGHQPVHHPVGHGHQDRGLAVEVAVDAGPDDAGLGADIRQ